MAYVIQREELIRLALAQIALAPHAEEGATIPTPEEVVAHFDEWLYGEPEEARMTAEDMEQRELWELLGVGRRHR